MLVKLVKNGPCTKILEGQAGQPRGLHIFNRHLFMPQAEPNYGTDTQVGSPQALIPLVMVRDVKKSGMSMGGCKLGLRHRTRPGG